MRDHGRGARPGRTGSRFAARAGCLSLVALTVACAARLPPRPQTLAHPDYVYPFVPASLQGSRAVRDHERGWRYLQGDATEQAAHAFGEALERAPAFYPSLAGQGYVALATSRHARAIEAFDAALERAAQYAPALVGRGQALVALDRSEEAAAAFEAAIAADPALADLGNRVAVLRLRITQDRIARARAASKAGRLEDARDEYAAVIAGSPDSAFLHRELGLVEARRGAETSALEHLRRAAALDPADAATRIDIGALLEAREDFEGAIASYREAFELDPDPALADRIAEVDARAREARLPPEFRAIADAPQVTRGQLAALLGVRFASLLEAAPPRQSVITDIRGYWAEAWIRLVTAAGVMDAFDNHTFGPDAPVRRSDLAIAARRIALLADSSRPELSLRPANRPAIADVTPAHLSYPAVSFVVASGVMPLVDNARFQASRIVAGPEAIEVVERLRRLAPAR